MMKLFAVLGSIYMVMATINFPLDLLQRDQNHIAVVGQTGVLWSDWERPERIADSLCRIGKQPAFPRRHLRADADMNPVEAESRSVGGARARPRRFL